MALNNLGLGFLFTARDLASGVMTRVQGNFNKTASATTRSSAAMNAAFGATALGLGAMSAGLGTLAVSFAAADQFSKFEQGLAAVKAVTKATTEEVELLRDAAIQAGIDTQFSPDEATEGLLSLATAGQTATQATKTLIPVLDLAAGSLGQLGVAQSAEAVVGTLNAYGFAADKAGNVTDRLLRITQLTNFQTRDFETGLAKAAAAGATFNQGLDDVLITMGLLRNRNIDASSSATAFREATRRLGSDQRAQQAITDQGIDIFDKNTGKMRSVIDVTSDLVAKTKDMSDEERNRIVVQGFGARGLLAFNAIQKAMFTTTVNGKKVTLEGTAAIEAMRKEMGKAGGTAAQFREALLDTFEGQKTLLKGTLQTLSITSGEAFAKTFKPVISVITDALNKLIVLIKATPTPLKQLIAGIVILFGAFTTVGGSIALFGAAVALLLPLLKVIAITFAVVLTAMLPVIAAVGVLTLAIVGFKTALDELPGSFSQGASLMERFKLGVDALKQLFAQGGFSGTVRKELNEKANEGLRNFVISVFLFVNRIRNFFSGLTTGFRATIREFGPLFEQMFAAFENVGKALGFLGEKADAGDAKGKFAQMGLAGQRVGQVIAKAFGVIVRVITLVSNAVAFAIEKWRELQEPLAPLRVAAANLGETFLNLGRRLGLVDTTGAQSSAEGLGEAFTLAARAIIFAMGVVASQISFTVNTIGALFGGLVGMVQAAVGIIVGLFDIVVGVLTGDWARAWDGAKSVVLNVVKAIISGISAMAEVVTGSIDAIAGAFGVRLDLTKAAIGGKQDLVRDLDKFFGLQEQSNQKVFEAQQEAEPAVASPTTGGFNTRRAEPIPEAAIAQTEAFAASHGTSGAGELAEAARELLRAKEGPIHTRTVLMLENEVLATAVSKAERGARATGFSPEGTSAE